MNENSGSNSSTTSSSGAVQGQIRQAKDIEATIVHRSEISKGFTISLERWHHQLATATIKGRLTTKTDTEILEGVQAKEDAEREKQARKGEENKKAQRKAMDQENGKITTTNLKESCFTSHFLSYTYICASRTQHDIPSLS